MFNKETNDLISFLEKEASESSTGMSQAKKKTQVHQRDYEGEGAGLGAIIGAGSGALAKKYKPLTTSIGAAVGSFLGKEIGKRTIGTSKTRVSEGTVKKQEKKPQGAQVPRLTDQKVLKLIEGNKK